MKSRNYLVELWGRGDLENNIGTVDWGQEGTVIPVEFTIWEPHLSLKGAARGAERCIISGTKSAVW